MKEQGKRRKPMNLNKLIALIFFLVILLGTVLLALPIAARSGKSLGIKTALFTATSSTCVTGLVLADTYTVWSGFGQAVILCLIEIGGLGFMSAASFVIFTLRRRINMSTQMMIAQTTGAEGFDDALRVQKRMLGFSFVFELAGAAILALRFMREYPFLTSLKLGVFHSVSAFCNAGFDILGFRSPDSSLTTYATDPIICLTIAFLIIFGGIGFVVWDEIFQRKSPKKWSVYTKLVLISTAALLIFGTVFLGITEWKNSATLGGMSVPQKILALFFQSTTTRTAGFAGINQGAMTEGSKAVSIFLMLVGGSSGSTAGGIKTVTFLVIIAFLFTRLRSKRNVVLFHRTASNKLVLNALTLFGVFVSLNFIGAAFICTASGVPFTDGLFETVSALSTVGLTTGITPDLSLLSQLLLIVYMYFGRVGILTLSLGFLRNSDSNGGYMYAETNLLIG